MSKESMVLTATIFVVVLVIYPLLYVSLWFGLLIPVGMILASKLSVTLYRRYRKAP